MSLGERKSSEKRGQKIGDELKKERGEKLPAQKKRKY